MIESFADATTRDLFAGVDTKAARKVPKAIWPAAKRRLDVLNYATTLKDLTDNPGNHLEKLKGDLAGFYSIRVNAQYRVVFRFKDGASRDVTVTDYH